MTIWGILGLIALVCAVILFVIGRRALIEGRRKADENLRIYQDRYNSPKP